MYQLRQSARTFRLAEATAAVESYREQNYTHASELHATGQPAAPGPGCTQLDRLPSYVSMLSSLRHLSLSGCNQLVELSPEVSRLSSLRLDLSGCISPLSIEFEGLSRLQHVNLSFCQLSTLSPGVGRLQTCSS